MSSIKTYDEYLDAIRNSPTEMFWMVPDDVLVSPEFKFDIYFPIDNEYDRKMNHVFLNGDFYDGIVLFSRHKKVTEKEFNNRFFIEKKEWPLLASSPKTFQYDIVFISYNEINADENYNNLINRFPNAKRVHGIKGIHQAHIEAAKLATTDLFWVVDGDAIIVDDFNFQFAVNYHMRNAVHVWRSQNPINGLEYGYGGVKLLPRELTLEMDVNSPDMTTSISRNFRVIEKVSNITNFNTDAFSTWRSAFRECVKLSSRAIDRQDEEETKKRLDIWCTVGRDKPFGEYAIRGAKEGREYGERCKGEKELLAKINDFDWLRRQYDI
jgi:hypothetical protein